jgi:hypothetical protein
VQMSVNENIADAAPRLASKNNFVNKTTKLISTAFFV